MPPRPLPLESPCRAQCQGPYLWLLPIIRFGLQRDGGRGRLWEPGLFQTLINCPLCTSAGPLLPPIAAGPVQRAAVPWSIYRETQRWTWRKHPDAWKGLTGHRV